MLTGQILERSAKRFPNKTAIICDDTELSYRELDEQANQLANALLSLGLKKGAKVAMLSRNLAEYGTVFFGVARTGYVLTNISVLYAPDELAYVLNKADVEVLIFDALFAEKVEAVRAQLPKLKCLVSIGENSAVPDAHGFLDFLSGQSAEHPEAELSELDPFCMTYTGGTTGRPKGVLCNHRARAITAHTVMVEEALDERDRVGIVTPLFHVAALNIMFQPAILAGATTLFLTKWEPAAFVAMAQQHKMTANFMVPTQAVMLLNDESFDAEALQTWRKASFAGAPMPDWVQSELRKRLPGLRLTQIYGQSEMGVITVLRHWYLPQKLGSVGRQAYNVDIRVVDSDGRDVAPGEIGEIVSRGDNLMMEYYDEPEQTRSFFKLGDGWGWSGDVATIDDDGFITLIDRSKDMIISGGENIYPKEIEDAIYDLPQVAECAVFGIPDDKWGEVAAAYLLLKPDSQLSTDLVIEHCTQKLAPFKRPRIVQFVDDFPRTPIGKIQKNILKEEFWNRREKKI